MHIQYNFSVYESGQRDLLHCKNDCWPGLWKWIWRLKMFHWCEPWTNIVEGRCCRFHKPRPGISHTFDFYRHCMIFAVVNLWFPKSEIVQKLSKSKKSYIFLENLDDLQFFGSSDGPLSDYMEPKKIISYLRNTQFLKLFKYQYKCIRCIYNTIYVIHFETIMHTTKMSFKMNFTLK